ncbi:MAG: hypothetical protein JST16_11695 [Bdellovibrionales bacterium]|nr:hypothetical protein [Bdellovibrionales bacterium]
MKKHICIAIGAGASLGARSRFAAKPPTGPDLLDKLKLYLSESIGSPPTVLDVPMSQNTLRSMCALNTALSIHELAQYRNYERLIAHLYQNNSEAGEWAEVADSLRILSAIYFLAPNTPFRKDKDLYSELAEQIHALITGGMKVSILSLNYDILLEEALDQIGIKYGYVGLWGQSSASFGSPDVLFFKPHGSCNWRLINPAHGSPIRLEDEETLRGTSLEGTICSQDRTTALVSLYSGELPVMADYCDQKTGPMGQGTLKEIRRVFSKETIKFDEIFICGMNPVFAADVDQFVATELFGKNASKTTVFVFNPKDPCRKELVRRGFNSTIGGLDVLISRLKELKKKQ